MKSELIAQLHSEFERLVHTDTESGVEFWLGRELQKVLGYTRWENFVRVIRKAITACKTAGYDANDHFLEVTKMVPLGSGAERPVEDYALTRYACYLIAQNGDSSKNSIAFAQTYFAVQTRRQELIEKRLADMERVDARKKLTASEKQLSGLIYERVQDERSFARIRSKGDQALFGGATTQEMKQRLKVPSSRALADFLPTITLKAKDFANEITNFNVKRDYLNTEAKIAREHVKNNREVRRLLGNRRIKPEGLPAAEDVKKIERRHSTEEKKLPKLTKRLASPESHGPDDQDVSEPG